MVSQINRTHSGLDRHTYLAESKKKMNTKLALQTKTKLVANASLFFAVLGILVMVLETELIANAVYKNVFFSSIQQVVIKHLIFLKFFRDQWLQSWPSPSFH